MTRIKCLLFLKLCRTNAESPYQVLVRLMTLDQSCRIIRGAAQLMNASRLAFLLSSLARTTSSSLISVAFNFHFFLFDTVSRPTQTISS